MEGRHRKKAHVDLSGLRVCIIGTGAMASLFGARLSRVAKVTMLGSWQEQITALRAGATFEERDGSTWRFQLEAFSQLPKGCVADLAIILTKGYRNRQAAELVASCLQADSDPGLVLTLQNGLGNDLLLQEKIAPDRILVGATTQAANLPQPGHVKDNGAGPVFLPELPGREEALALLSGLFEEAGFEVIVSADTEVLLWRKLLVNAAINPLTAIFKVKNGRLAEKASYRDLLVRLGREVIAVAEAQGLDLGIEDLSEYLLGVCRSTANNQSSMLRDVLRQGPTENETINGAVVRAAQAAGIETPWNHRVYQLVREIESGKRLPGSLAEIHL